MIISQVAYENVSFFIHMKVFVTVFQSLSLSPFFFFFVSGDPVAKLDGFGWFAMAV